MKSTTIKNAKLFIIPNSALTKDSLVLLDGEKVEDSLWASFAKARAEEVGSTFDIDRDAEVQIWVTDDNNDNLTSSMPDEIRKELFGKTYEEIGYNKCFTGFVPAKLLEGKKEGDIVTFTFPTGVQVSCELCQLGYRYRRFGKFEEALDYVLPVKYRRAS